MIICSIFWSNVNRKAKVSENTLKIGPLKVWFFLYPEYDPDISQNLNHFFLWAGSKHIKNSKVIK